jgi:D-threonate/D-erythronate kinase
MTERNDAMKIALIADDLTGANNAGVRLSRQGFVTTTAMLSTNTLPDQGDALCIDTDSRYLPQAEARDRVMQASRLMQDAGVPLLCKRIDTLLRGNLGAEIEAVLQVMGPDATAIVMAAFPESQRIVIGGYLLINGLPVQQNPVASGDAISPVRQSYIPHLISTQCEENIALVGLDTVLNGPAAIAAHLEGAAQAGNRIIVVDAISNEHVESIARAMAELTRVMVPVDPGPLSAAYAKAKFAPLAKQRQKILVSVGSSTSLTRQQVAYLINKWDTVPVCIQAHELVSRPEQRRQEIERVVTEGLQRLTMHAIVVVTTCPPGEPLLEMEALAQEKGVAPHLLSKQVTDGLAEISCELVLRSGGAIQGCFSSGGDATASLYKMARASGIRILDEVMPLVAYGQFTGGNLDGLPVVTKGGSVGDKETISHCVRFLLTRLAQS